MVSGGANKNWIEPVYKEIGARLELVRKQRGLSQRETIAHLGMSPGILNSWEGGMRIRVADLVRLCAALGITPGVILDGLDLKDCEPVPEAIAFRLQRAELWRGYKKKKRQARDAKAKKKPGQKPQKKAAKKKGRR